MLMENIDFTLATFQIVDAAAASSDTLAYYKLTRKNFGIIFEWIRQNGTASIFPQVNIEEIGYRQTTPFWGDRCLRINLNKYWMFTGSSESYFNKFIQSWQPFRSQSHDVLFRCELRGRKLKAFSFYAYTKSRIMMMLAKKYQ